MVVSRRLRAWVAFTLVLALVASTSLVAHAADEPARETEITRQVEITVSDLMPTDRDGRYYVEVRLHNKTRANLAGPIYISVDSLGVDELALDSADSKLSDGTRCVRIVSDVSQLRANADSASKRVYFKSETKLSVEQTDLFDATLTVWQGKKLPGQTRQTTERRDSGFPPTGQSTAESGRTGQKAGPMPDPAFEKEDTEAGTEEAKAENDKQIRKELKLPTDEEVAKVIQSQNQMKPQLRKIPGVVGSSTSLSDDGKAIIRVLVKDLDTADQIPKQFNGVPVETKVMEGVPSFLQAPDPNKPLDGSNRGQIGKPNPNYNPGFNPNCLPQNPQAIFSRPVPIGVSVFNDSFLMPCAAGTLGCRVKDRFGNVYILSNSHVIADNGSPLVSVGDPITQPASGDFNCFQGLPFTIVASLSDYTVDSPIFPNSIDAAIAITTPLQVGVATPCDGYGAPRENVIPAKLGMPVMKYGRTTGLKASVISSLNTEITIGTSLYVDLIEITPGVGTRGDSGSLIVNSQTREPVGLFFAGLINLPTNFAFNGYAIPIQRVLDRFSVTIDGDPSLP